MTSWGLSIGIPVHARTKILKQQVKFYIFASTDPWLTVGRDISRENKFTRFISDFLLETWGDEGRNNFGSDLRRVFVVSHWMEKRGKNSKTANTYSVSISYLESRRPRVINKSDVIVPFAALCKPFKTQFIIDFPSFKGKCEMTKTVWVMLPHLLLKSFGIA